MFCILHVPSLESTMLWGGATERNRMLIEIDPTKKLTKKSLIEGIKSQLNPQVDRVQTYDQEEANQAIKEWGKSARMFQKSLSDGKGSLYTITRQNGKIVDIIEDFDPIFS